MQLKRVALFQMGNAQTTEPAPAVTTVQIICMYCRHSLLISLEQEAPPVGKSGKKICCSCPDTKKARDECVVSKGEEQCADLIEAHKVCLRNEGFKVA